ncbi:hypothetical protein D0962_18800 [Leptolyngbyaceae cyanobacterium CCMR0082]|uniref:Tyr recombinase domain-containing protein n=2 Tax=Adonisia TaxID=2950183 RepID=A0A6M0S8S7_9CYAN|nr:hypothetical protein [Adonisia turfae CCMR0082]
MPKPLPSPLSGKINEINLRLKMDGYRVAISIRGKHNFLYLVSTLPPKPESTRSKPFQQRISLGYPASLPGIKRAETQARLLGAQLVENNFDWGKWRGAPAKSAKTGEESLAQYKTYVIENRLNRDKYDDSEIETLWRRRFLDRGLLKLAIPRALSLNDFEAIAKELKPGTAQARYVTVELRHFAKFCGLTGVDECLMPYQGNYNPKRPKNKRIIPTDEDIEKLLTKIINPSWRYVFCMMATFGLRNHEVWNASLEYRTKGGKTFPVCLVSDGKTGSREVYPMPSRWVDLFDLPSKKLPTLSVSHVRHGEKTARAFLRQCDRIDHTPDWRPYSLRHAYAIRCIRNGVPDAISCKWLGHSIVTFREIYSKWISRSESEDIWLDLNM